MIGSTPAAKGSSDARWRTAECHVKPPTEAAWRVWENFCVAANGEDLTETKWSSGDASREHCKQQCAQRPDCSAYEWYDQAWEGVKCRLMIGSTPAAKGSSDARWRTAECHVKPPTEARKAFTRLSPDGWCKSA